VKKKEKVLNLVSVKKKKIGFCAFNCTPTTIA